MADFYMSKPHYVFEQLCKDIEDQQREVSVEEAVKVLRDVPLDKRTLHCKTVLTFSATAARKDLIRAIVIEFNCDVETMSRGILKGIVDASNVNIDMLKFAVDEMESKVDIKFGGRFTFHSSVTRAIKNDNFKLFKALVDDFKADVNFGIENDRFPLQVAMKHDHRYNFTYKLDSMDKKLDHG